MFKTVATLPFVAALLASNTVGLELVSRPEDECVETVALDALYSSLHVTDSALSKRSSGMSKIRRLSHAASNVYVPKSQVSDEKVRRRADSKPSDILGLKDRSDWRPIFNGSEKSMSIRRLYPAKAQGRAHLAPVSSNRTNILPVERPLSISSAESLMEESSLPTSLHIKPQNTSPFAKMITTQPELDRLPVIESSDGYGPDSEGTSGLRPRNVSEDTTYGTMHRNDYIDENTDAPCSSHDLPSATLLSAQGQNRPASRFSANTNSARPGAGSRQISASSIGESRPTAGRAKGHNRNESVVSIWTVGSSPESVKSSPPLNKRKPLQLQLRPPVPNFDASPATAPIGKTFGITPISPPCSGSQTLSSRPKIPPRTSSREASIKLARPKSMPSSQHMFKTMSQPSESWDDDFGDLEVQVPASLRQTQETVRGHLWQFRQFSELIAELKRMRTTQLQKPSKRLPEGHQVWEEIDALVAIASRGEEGTISAQEIQYSSVHDDTISRILGQFRRHGGKVRLDETILAELIDKASCLARDIQLITKDEPR